MDKAGFFVFVKFCLEILREFLKRCQYSYGNEIKGFILSYIEILFLLNLQSDHIKKNPVKGYHFTMTNRNAVLDIFFLDGDF